MRKTRARTFCAPTTWNGHLQRHFTWQLALQGIHCIHVSICWQSQTLQEIEENRANYLDRTYFMRLDIFDHHMLIWQAYISFDIDLEPIKLVKKTLFFDKNGYSSLSGLNQQHLARSHPTFRKSLGKIGQTVLKIETFFSHIVSSLLIKLVVTVTVFRTSFHVKQSEFDNIRWFLSYTWRCMKKDKNLYMSRNAIDASILKIFCLKTDIKISRPASVLCRNFQVEYFHLFEKRTAKQRHVLAA